MSERVVFSEKQYLGREFVPLSIRLVLVIVCFAVYAFTAVGDSNGDVLAVVGFAILVISIIMGFLVHFRTNVENKSILLSGLWTSRLVKIDLNSIVKAEVLPYSRDFINNPVYNLHTKGTIRFYAAGRDAVYLTDRDGLIYIIGSLHPHELFRAVKAEMEGKL
ncbi:MAG: hypothetical protein V4619_02965 [Bacteroidota bacterium]